MFAFCVGSIVWILSCFPFTQLFLVCYGRACLALPVILLFATYWRTGFLDPGDGHGHVSRTDNELARGTPCQRPIPETRLWIQKKREELLNSLECRQQSANEESMRHIVSPKKFLLDVAFLFSCAQRRGEDTSRLFSRVPMRRKTGFQKKVCVPRFFFGLFCFRFLLVSF